MRCSSHLRRGALAFSVAALLPFASSAVAQAAGSVSSDGTVIHVTEDAPGEQNFVTVGVQTAGIVEISDRGEIEIGAGCVRSDIDPQTAHCPLPPGGVAVAAGGGDDTVGVYVASGVAPLPDGALQVALGDGNDIFNGGVAGEVVDGGPGNDTLRGDAGDDRLDGGDGDDALVGGVGRDQLRAGAGDDRLSGDDSSERGVFADLLDGGPGVDTLADWRAQGGESAAPPISVTLDGVADDGRGGEGDDVRAIEVLLPESPGTFVGDDGPNEWHVPAAAPGSRLTGAGGNDVLRGGDRHGDAIDGGAGDDDLSGGFGDDTLVGGPGRDTIAGDRPLRCNELHCDLGGGSGNDAIEARDGEVDSIACGAGSDRVLADASDVVAADCEVVERPADGPPRRDDDQQRASGRRLTLALAGAVRLRSALRSGLRVRVAGAKPGATVKVTLVLAASAARRAGLTRGKRPVAIAAGAARAGSRGTATVRLRFTRAARTRLARVKRLAPTLRAGASSRAIVLRR
jgi:hypothetical protein